MSAFSFRPSRTLVICCLLGGLLLPTSGWAADPGADAADSSAPAADAAPSPSDAIANSVVKIFGTLRYPDFSKPWAKQAPTEISGSGMVIEGKRILTNAHMVLYASEIEIQANQAGDKISASVEAVAPGIDLAVLKLDDETFFDTHPPLLRASNLPRIKDSVLVYGYPTGGTTLSITKGIVSRIEYTYFNFPVSGLRIQIDAAINHGNSGGPAMVGNQVIGLAYSFLSSAQNIGYIIPTEEIELMLHSIDQGAYKGKDTFFDGLQTLENPALRKFLQMGPSVHGIVVNTPDSADPAYPLKRWDVITRIGDQPVDDQGMISLGGDLRVGFAYETQHLEHAGTVPLTVWRSGKSVPINLPVKNEYPTLFPDLRGSYPSYFIYGPLVFTAASAQFLGFVESTPAMSRLLEAHMSPLITRQSEKPAFEGEGLVCVSSPFFPGPLAVGYSDPITRVVASVNGVHIRNLGHLVQVLRDLKDPYVIIDFADKHVERLVFPRESMVSATEGILNDNGIRNQGTPDTMAVWNGGKP